MEEETKPKSTHATIHASANEKTNVLAILIGITLFLTIVNVVGTYSLQGKISALSNTATAPTPTTAPSAAAPSAPQLVQVDAGTDVPKGDANAKVTIIEFSDYQCPYCISFEQQTMPQIESQYIKTGKVKFVYRDFPLPFHQYAQKAAEASECAKAQGKFWEMHDKLFAANGDLAVDKLKGFAKDLGLDTTKFNTCLDSGETASEISTDTNAGSAAGVTGTPSFVINGQLRVGAKPFSAFQQIIDAELNK